MSVWDVIEIAAWVLSAIIAIWLIADAIRVSREYDEDFLTTVIEIEELPEDGEIDEEGARQ
jgi:hypothetical protein